MKNKLIYILLLFVLGMTTYAQHGYHPLERGWAVATCYAENSDEHVFGYIDIRNPQDNGAQTGEHWSPPPPMYHHEDWDREHLGNIFGIAVADDLNNQVFLTATSSYRQDFTGSLSDPTDPYGSIFTVDKVTGEPRLFATLPNHGSGLGNICYNKKDKKLYVTNMEDGKIYILDAYTGTVLSTYDPFQPDDLAIGFAPLEERLWGIEYYKGRIYFSVWNNNHGNESNTSVNESEINKIYSVEVNNNGGININSLSLEIEIPYFSNYSFQNTTYSNPVSDISFNCNGNILLAEKTMTNNTYSSAHRSRVLEFEKQIFNWVLKHNYPIGSPDNSGGQLTTNSAGGVSVIKNDIVVTADALRYITGNYVYGLDILKQYETDALNGYYIDLDNNIETPVKWTIGDVEVFGVNCPDDDVCCYNNTRENTNNIWFFGDNAGLDFNNLDANGNPTPIDATVFKNDPNFNMYTFEGCATISNPDGSLLFHTDGQKIYDESLNVIASGLNGHSSSTQSSIVIPKPNTDGYYIVTADWKDGLNGVRYSTYYPSNGTNSFNEPLIDSDKTSEKITSILGCDENIWVIGHEIDGDNSNYQIFNANSTGISPVNSNYILPASTSGVPSNYEKLGQLKTSHDGELIAGAIFHTGEIQLLKFDNENGIITNHVRIVLDDINGLNPDGVYGVEFSPNNQFLYVTMTNSKWYSPNHQHLYYNGIIQIDLNSITFNNQIINYSPQVIANYEAIPNDVDMDPLSLEIGPDGSIYVANDINAWRDTGQGSSVNGGTTLGVINNPNELGSACNFVYDQITLATGTKVRRGLPNFMPIPPSTITISSDNDFDCIERKGVINIVASGGVQPYTYEWSDNNIGNVSQTDGLEEGSYSVTVTDANGCYNVLAVELVSDCPETCCYNNTRENTNNIWFFGDNAGLDFNNLDANGNPTPIDAAVFKNDPNFNMYTFEGCATNSNPDGGLLFHTDGQKIYDESLNVVASGLLGHSSSSQSSIIIPKPNTDGYYIVTSDYKEGTNGINYYTYSPSDFQLSTDINLVSNNENPSEKLTSIKGCNDNESWLITHSFRNATNASYKVFKVDEDQISQVPNQEYHLSVLPSSIEAGYLKFSVEGDMLASCYARNGEVGIMSFDKNTGEITGHNKLFFQSINGKPLEKPYGAEFSKSGKYLYVSFNKNNTEAEANYFSGIVQLDISQFDFDGSIVNIQPSDISCFYEYNFQNSAPYALQYGPDNKIYIANNSFISYNPNTNQGNGGSQYIGVINNPEIEGIGCDISPLEIKLVSGTLSRIGLPNFMPIPSNTITVSSDSYYHCAKITKGIIYVTPSGGVQPYSYEWSDNTLPNQPLASGLDEGSYSVTVTDANGCFAVHTAEIEKNCHQEPADESCANCIGSFAPMRDKEYILTAWAKEVGAAKDKMTYDAPIIDVKFTLDDVSASVITVATAVPSGFIIDDWQRIETSFIVPSNAENIELELRNGGVAKQVLFDDIRVFPVNGSMKSFVYDPVTMRLMAELDERHYATFYEYDEEGKLMRLKKETERGIMTIQETRSNTVKKQ